jgi:hypothetical protein
MPVQYYAVLSKTVHYGCEVLWSTIKNYLYKARMLLEDDSFYLLNAPHPSSK